MDTPTTTTRPSALALLVFLGAALSAAAETAPVAETPAFGWFGELAGACWSGIDETGKPTDRQCYTKQYGFVRAAISRFAGSETSRDKSEGDSLFAWDAASGEIRFDTWSSSGAFGSGVARYDGTRLLFPQAGRAEPDEGRLRTAWERVAADSYRVVQERNENGVWRPVVAVTYRRDAVAPAPPPSSAAPAPGGPLESFAFLAGSCWLGTFAGGKMQDENCFEWTLDGRYLRSRHKVIGGKEPYEGETLYAFDKRRGTAGFVYWNSAGSVMRGDAEPAGDAIDFPIETVEMSGESFEIKSVWKLARPDRYSAVTSRRYGEEWRELFRIEFVRVGSTAAAAAPTSN